MTYSDFVEIGLAPRNDSMLLERAREGGWSPQQLADALANEMNFQHWQGVAFLQNYATRMQGELREGHYNGRLAGLLGYT